MNQIVIDILGIVTAVLLLIFSAFSFVYKKGKTNSHRFLSAFLFVNAVFIIGYLVPEIENTFSVNLRWLGVLGYNFSFLFGPLLYLYTKSITASNFEFNSTYFLHFLPFLIVVLSSFTGLKVPFLYIYIMMQFQISVYMVVCFVVILNYRKEIKKYFSSIDNLNLTWMLYVVGAFFIMWMIDLISFILVSSQLIDAFMERNFVFVSIFINFVFAVLIFYKALAHPEIFSGVLKAGPILKYEQSKLTDEKKAEYLNRLEHYFSQRKPFLSPSLTINDVASDLQISSKYISQIINESLHKNFYDFINSYRIEESKRLLRESYNSGKTVLEILYDSGFNSKSAFNAAFKKQTGTTPTSYKNRILSA